MQVCAECVHPTSVGVCAECVHPAADKTVTKAGIVTKAALSLSTAISRADIASHTQYPLKAIFWAREKMPIIIDPLVTRRDEL